MKKKGENYESDKIDWFRTQHHHNKSKPLTKSIIKTGSENRFVFTCNHVKGSEKTIASQGWKNHLMMSLSRNKITNDDFKAYVNGTHHINKPPAGKVKSGVIYMTLIVPFSNMSTLYHSES